MERQSHRIQPGRRARSLAFAIVPAVAVLAVADATVASAGPSAAPTKLTSALRPSAHQEFAKRTARGSFRAVYSPAARTLRFRLKYSGMTGPVRVAELHIGKITHAGMTRRYQLCDVSYFPCVANKWLTLKQVFPDLIDQLARHGGYIDLHTLRNTTGEAAGKLRITR